MGQRLSLPSMIYLEKELLNFYGETTSNKNVIEFIKSNDYLESQFNIGNFKNQSQMFD